MRFEFEGKTYDFDGSYFTVAEAMFFKDKAGTNLPGINVELALGNPYVIAAVVYVAKQRVGEKVRWQDLLSCNISTFNPLPDEKLDADDDGADSDGEAKLERRNPTGTVGKTRRRATTST